MIEGTYFSYFVSLIPNNHCTICSHFLPEWADEKNWEYNYINRKVEYIWRNCPSCNRLSRKLFISAEQELAPPITVPDEFITKPQGKPEEGHVPKQGCERKSWHPDYWGDYIKNNPTPTQQKQNTKRVDQEAIDLAFRNDMKAKLLELMKPKT
jgi:hypothetical protein